MEKLQDYIVEQRHVGVVSENLDAHVARLCELFGVDAGEVTWIPERGVEADTRFAFLELGGVRLEIIQAIAEQYREVLLQSGSGVNHLCYTVSDIAAVVRIMAANGVRPGHVTPDGIIATPSFRMVYFDPRDTAGVLLEFVEERC